MKKPSKKAAAVSVPPKNIKGAATPSGKKKSFGPTPPMGGVYGVTAKKSEPDNAPQKQRAMRVARLTGKIL